MDISWYGQACFKIKGKSVSIVIDPFDPDFTGLKLPKPADLTADIIIKTHDHRDHNFLGAVGGSPVVVDGPGEYEIKGTVIVGVATFHDKKEGAERGSNVVYNIEVDGVRIVHLGDLGHLLSEAQLIALSSCDIVLVPTGGTYTITAKEAAEVVSQLEPSIVVPMHYGLPGLKFPLTEVGVFLKEMGAEGLEEQPKLTITKDKLPDEMKVILLRKS